ncbi:MAG: OmpA family protein [Gammaproteobacteria bacterium]|jgi:OOP family OmpA-OmpF porin|nr:OmpA family protein [Gammaproteobacteria bacterium]
MRKGLHSYLAAVAAVVLLYGCSSNPPYSPPPFDAVQLNPSAYSQKVASFVVILDASASMKHKSGGQVRYDSAMDTVYRMNQTIPPLDYQAGLTAFSSGTCLDGASTRMLYGMTSYQRADFASAMDSIHCAGGTTPLVEAVDLGTKSLNTALGDAAVIIVSDFHGLDSASTIAAIRQMQTASGNHLCIHTINTGDDTWDQQLAVELAGISNCGSAVHAADIAAADRMADYVTAVLLAPAAPVAAQVQYEKNTVSTSALFDFDKAILKEQGKVALHELGDAIKARGARVVDIDIIGHTDSIGSADYNMGLSVRRAEAVRDYLVSEGIDAAIIDVSGEGENKPIASNDTAQGRAENRRVDINVGIEQAPK